MALHPSKKQKLDHFLKIGGTDSDNENSSERDLKDSTEHVLSQEEIDMRARHSAPSRIIADRSGRLDISGMLKLQTDELLAKVRPNYEKRITRAENALLKVRNIIERIPSREALPISEAERKMLKSHHIQIPFSEPRPGNDAKYTLAYSRPVNVNVVGSFARKTAIQVGERLAIDLAVTMPSSIFQDKDYLNHRYFHKRAYYLACLAAGIQEAEDCDFIITFTCQHDNPLQPILLIDPGSDKGEVDFKKSNCRIKIILAAREDLFPITKTLPTRNCVRIRGHDASSTQRSSPPTPFYNASLRSECCSLPYLKFLHASSLRSDAFGGACTLGSVWLRQRGLSATLAGGGFGPFEWACMMAVLMQNGGSKGSPILFSGYSSSQLFKALLQFLSGRDLIMHPLCIGSDEMTSVEYETPVFFDGTRGLNVLFKMSSWSYRLLRHEASITLEALNGRLSDGFETTFITKSDDPLQRFDCIFKVHVSQTWTPSSEIWDLTSKPHVFCNELHKAIMTGLGDRATLVYPSRDSDSAWSTASSNHGHEIRHSVLVGVLVNADHVNRSIDKGPSAEDKQAAATFRKFWGEKAELRRFKDGSILESLIWNSLDAKSSVLQQIIIYVIQRHLGEEIAGDIAFLGESIDRLLPGPRTAVMDCVMLYQPLSSAFETLEKELRCMEGLPLQIRQTSAASPDLRYASLNVPNLGPAAPMMKPADVYVQFEGSARWPDDLSAVQQIKIALLLKIGELLNEQTVGLTARLGLENANHKFLNLAFLDILYPSGAAFRLRVHHERELNLLERLLKHTPYDQREKEAVAFATSTYKREFVQGPLHTQAIRTLATRFPLLSPSMRLMKLWRDSHLLSSHVSDELIELLTIRTFVHPYPWQAPASLRTGFLRTLTFISKWDWRTEPLIVEINGDSSSSNIQSIVLQFEAWRKIDPGMNRIAMFAASDLDQTGVTWTEIGPSKVVAARFTSLAKAACSLVKEQALHLEAQALFAASYVDYDFVIHLSPRHIADSPDVDKNQSTFKNLKLQVVEDTELVAFDPVQLFMDELCTMYGNNIIFFRNVQENSLIAGLWSPQTRPRPWKVHVSYSAMPVLQPGDQAPEISINKAATLNDIARLGGDLVSKIESLQQRNGR